MRRFIDSIRRRNSAPVYRQAEQKTLHAKNEFYEDTADYEMIEGHWRCTRAAECLRFLIGLSPAEAKMDLLRRGFTFYFSSRSTARPATSDQGIGLEGNAAHTRPSLENNANPGNGTTKLASSEGVKVSGSTVAQAKHQQSPAASKASVPLAPTDRPACGLTHNAAQESLRVFQPPTDGQNHPLLVESVIGDLDTTAGAVP